MSMPVQFYVIFVMYVVLCVHYMDLPKLSFETCSKFRFATQADGRVFVNVDKAAITVSYFSSFLM